jgi:chemotaxis signal transduction protein
MNSEVYTGQAIVCGDWSLTLNMQWANTIVDSFELVNIPRAPNWLIGAANIEGNIVPVVDLAVYFDPSMTPTVIGRHHRIIVGGKREENAEGSVGNDSTFAILFSGLPMQIQYKREAIKADTVLPERLRELSLGMAMQHIGAAVSKPYFEMNTNRFIEFLSNSLI